MAKKTKTPRECAVCGYDRPKGKEAKGWKRVKGQDYCDTCIEDMEGALMQFEHLDWDFMREIVDS